MEPRAESHRLGQIVGGFDPIGLVHSLWQKWYSPRERTMPSPADRARSLLNQISLAHSKELEQVGLSRSQIQRLLEQGVLERVGRGLYRLAGGTITETDDLASASKLVPGGGGLPTLGPSVSRPNHPEPGGSVDDHRCKSLASAD